MVYGELTRSHLCPFVISSAISLASYSGKLLRYLSKRKALMMCRLMRYRTKTRTGKAWKVKSLIALNDVSNMNWDTVSIDY